MQTLTSVADKEEPSNRTFVDCIGEYIAQLQSSLPARNNKVEEIVVENKRLRKRLAQY